MKIVLILAGLVLAAFLVDRLLLWMEWRGWIDYRRTYPGRMNHGQVGPAFLTIQGLLEPEKRHAAEEQTALRTQEDESGGPDGTKACHPEGRRHEGSLLMRRRGLKRDPSLRSG